MAVAHHRTAKNRELNWHNRPWLPDIYKERADQIVIPKASQLGISEYLFVKKMSMAQHGLNGMYILPTESIRNRVVSARVDPIINYVPFYRDNVAKERTGAAERDRWIKVGNPERSGAGIEVEFELSNGSIWHIKCDSCNEWQYLDWFVNFVDIDSKGGYFLRGLMLDGGVDASALCRRCFKPLDRLKPGEWVKARSNIQIAGRRCDKMFGSPGTDSPANPRPIIKEMFSAFTKAQHNETAMSIFYNQQLGIPYEAEGNHISVSMLSACIDVEYALPPGALKDEDGKQIETIAGMDIGGVHHLHISAVVKDKQGRRIRKKVFIGNVKSWEEADRVCRLYGVRNGVLDAMGEIHPQRQWIREHSGWRMCYYSIGREKVKEGVTINHTDKTIRVNRTESLDASYAAYAEQRIVLPKNGLSLDGGDFVRQMTAAVRRFDERKGYYIWDEGGKPDHHQHADNYERLALEMYKSAAGLVMIV